MRGQSPKLFGKKFDKKRGSGGTMGPSERRGFGGTMGPHDLKMKKKI